MVTSCDPSNGAKAANNLQQFDACCEPRTKSFKRRFWMLAMYFVLAVLAGVIFPEFVAIADVTKCFYRVTNEAVNWSSMIAMVSYVVLIIPFTWLMNKTGLRVTMILGSVLTTIGFAVQFATLSPGSYAFVIVSAFFGAVAAVIFLTMPPYLASVWFPSNEVSRACAVGVFGNMLGVALGFVVPPLLIPGNCSEGELIVDGKKRFAVIFTTISVATSILVVLTFQKEPECPPSVAQLSKNEIKEFYLSTCWSLLRNLNFDLMVVAYGLMFGAYHAIATLLNSIMVIYFPGEDIAIGWMGLLFNVTGLAGTIIAGYLLDFTHKFKEISVSICFLSFIACVAFSCLVSVKAIWVQFVTIGILGCFLISFMPVGFEYAIEMTFPESEVISAGVLNSAGMVFGVILTEIASALSVYSPAYTKAVFCSAFLLSGIITSFMTKEYKRTKRNEDSSNTS